MKFILSLKTFLHTFFMFIKVYIYFARTLIGYMIIINERKI